MLYSRFGAGVKANGGSKGEDRNKPGVGSLPSDDRSLRSTEYHRANTWRPRYRGSARHTRLAS